MRLYPGSEGSRGFSLLYVLTAALILIAGTATLMNQSASSVLGSIFQGQSLQARNVARSGMAYLISQINKEKNRHLLVLTDKQKNLNDNADSTLWTEATTNHLNPCATNTEQEQQAQLLPSLSDLNINSNGSSNFFYLSNDGTVRTTPTATDTRAFRIINRPNSKDLKIPLKTGSVLSLLDDTKNSGIFRLSVEAVVYRNSQRNEIISRTILQEDFSVVPKCCKAPFGRHWDPVNNAYKGHGNGNYAINRFDLSSNACMPNGVDTSGFGIVLISGNTSGFITASAGATIMNSDEEDINPIYCITSNPRNQCTAADNDSGNPMKSLDIQLPTLPTYPGNWGGSNPPPVLVPCTTLLSCPSNASGASGNNQLMQYKKIGDHWKTIFNAKNISSTSDLPPECILHKNDVHCIYSGINVGAEDLHLVSGENTGRIRFYFPRAGNVVTQTGSGILRHCKVEDCRLGGTGSVVSNITDASFFGCLTQQGNFECEPQTFNIKGSRETSRFFIFAPKAVVNITGRDRDIFEGVIWANGIDLTGTKRAPTILGTSVADVFILMGILPDASNTFNNSLAGHSYTDLFAWDMVARSSNRQRFFGN